ncbi:MAG: NAD-dependent epimerase/dehydratase family protein [Synechococcales cyanobacterium T60_A2020_003]|nr:NAD-dependent epimerase/dehydratase family protein [Synechococcales cyanobacterium T60_A2020_003]
MKAFVTGASGFTGSHLVKALCDRGDTVTALVRKTSNCDRLAEYPVNFIYGDITDRDALRQGMAGADVVFHAAAYVELGLVDEAKMARVNVDGTRAVLETAKELGIPKMVYCSTIGVFGDTQGKVINETFQRTQADFSSAYDRTKYDAQKLVDQFAAGGLNVSSLLPAGILGPDDPHFGPVMKTFLKGRLKLWAGGDRITGVVHVDDLVQAMLLAAEKGQPGGWYIISSGELSTRDMFAAVGKDAGIQPPAEAPEALVRLLGILLDPIGRLFNWQPPLSRERVHYIYDRCVRVDATKARQELGWNPRSLEQTLKDSKPL